MGLMAIFRTFTQNLIFEGIKEKLTHGFSILKGKLRYFYVSFHSGIIFLVIIPRPV